MEQAWSDVVPATPERPSPEAQRRGARAHFLAEDARDYLCLARHAEAERSLYWYRRALVSWRWANEGSGGRWHEELEAARREYRAALRRGARWPG